MKFLCLAYGDEAGWRALSAGEQDAALAQDEVLRGRGAIVAAVKLDATTVRAWEGPAVVTPGDFTNPALPLAGFGIIEAANLDEAIELAARTPCARAKGASVVRPIAAINI